MFGVPLSQCVEAAPWRKRSACTSASTGTDIPEITSPTASKASRSDSRTSVGSTISVQERVILFFGYFRYFSSHVEVLLFLSFVKYIVKLTLLVYY